MSLQIIQPLKLVYFILTQIPSASHLKLQKLAYYIDAWHLAYFDEPIVNENFQAWIHGPVLRSVWDSLKDKSPLYTELSLKPESKKKVYDEVISALSKDQIELIHDVIEEYGDKTAYHLEVLTHNELPWIEARKGKSPTERGEDSISKETMKAFYKTKLK